MSKALNLIIIIIITVVIVSSFLKYEQFSNEVSYVRSTIDNKSYLVRNMPDKIDAANLLATIKTKLSRLVNYISNKYPNDTAVERLVSKYNSDNISETGKNSKYTSYSVNKGEKIVFCIRSRDGKEELVEANTLMFVALHEIAHVMTKSIGHTDEFWNNFRFLLKEAIKINVYKRQDFRRHPVKYCGTEITDTPLND
tara:strand:- start:263 stop:853 length:591 start_codon:yes stop_codon:yes gene_type:complete